MVESAAIIWVCIVALLLMQLMSVLYFHAMILQIRFHHEKNINDVYKSLLRIQTTISNLIHDVETLIEEDERRDSNQLTSQSDANG